MALIYLEDYIDFNNYGDIVGVTYQIALDKDFKDLVYQDYLDKQHIHTKRVPIYVNYYNTPNEDVLNKELYVRCKIYYKGGGNQDIFESGWIVLKEDLKKNYIQPVKYEGLTIGYTYLNKRTNEKEVMILGETYN